MSNVKLPQYRWQQRLAWIVAGAELILITAAARFDYLSRSLPFSQIDTESWLASLIGAIPALAFLIIGLLIVIRLPDSRYGWVLIVFSFASGGWLNFFNSYVFYLYSTGGVTLRSLAQVDYLAGIGWITSVASLVFILLLFPTGQYLSRRWQIVGRLTYFFAAFAISLGIFRPGELGFIAQIQNPFGLAGFLGEAVGFLVNASAGVILIGIFSGILSVILQFSRSLGVERQQIKWFALAAFLNGLLLLTDNVTELPGLWENVKESLGLVLLPLAIGIAILRYRLWDIDVLIRRTLVYGALTLTLALVYFGSVVLLQLLFEAITGQGQSPIATVISTLGIAALFTPLRRRIQNDIDRRFYRQKYDAMQTLAAFTQTARDETRLEALVPALLGAVQDSLQPEQAWLWLKER